MKQSVMASLRALGDDFTLAQIMATRELFAALVAGPADVGAVVERDQAYGQDVKQRLDVFHRGDAGAQLPVVVFVHGGGFVQGDKGAADAPFYNNFGAWAVRAGFVGVTMTYRLAPAHKWPAGSVDVGAAVSWLAANVQRFGGSPQRIILVGTSAGATHVAGYFAGHGRAPGSQLPVAGGVFVSGLYRFGSDDTDPRNNDYFGPDLAQRAQFSTVAALVATPIPCLFTLSEFDPPMWHRQMAGLVDACVTTTGHYPRVLYLEGHNHVSNIMQLSSLGDTLGQPLAKFVRQCTGLEA
ncbi:MAG: alpha/beta hydrolase [Pseudomonadota bacterium]